MSLIIKVFSPEQEELDLFLSKNISKEIKNDYLDYYITIDETSLEECKNIFKDKLYLNEDTSIYKYFHELLLKENFSLAGAESCTAGLISKLITDQDGASKYFSYSVVTYSNSSKIDLLNVSKETLETKGAVSKNTIAQMLDGLLYQGMTNLAYAVSGIAGPGGGTKENPVGTVFIGVMKNGIRDVKKFFFTGNREEIRMKSAQQTLWEIIKKINL